MGGGGREQAEEIGETARRFNPSCLLRLAPTAPRIANVLDVGKAVWPSSQQRLPVHTVPTAVLFAHGLRARRVG